LLIPEKKSEGVKGYFDYFLFDGFEKGI